MPQSTYTSIIGLLLANQRGEERWNVRSQKEEARKESSRARHVTFRKSGMQKRGMTPIRKEKKIWKARPYIQFCLGGRASRLVTPHPTNLQPPYFTKLPCFALPCDMVSSHPLKTNYLTSKRKKNPVNTIFLLPRRCPSGSRIGDFHRRVYLQHLLISHNSVFVCLKQTMVSRRTSEARKGTDFPIADG